MKRNSYLKWGVVIMCLVSVLLTASRSYVIPSTPTGVTATGNGSTALEDKITVSWNISAGASIYYVYRGTSETTPEGDRTFLGVTAANYWDDTTITLANNQFFYWIRAWNADGFSGYSTPNWGYKAMPAPENLYASDGLYAYQVALDWDDVVDDGLTYYTLYKNTSNTLTGAESIGSIYGSSYNDTDVDRMVTYYYWVQGRNNQGYGKLSAVETGYSWQNFLSSPPDLKNTTYQTLTFRWNAVPNAAKYHFQISTESDFSSLIQGAVVTGTQYTWGPLPYGDTYYWRVRPYIYDTWQNWSSTWRVAVNKDTWEPNDTQGTAAGNFNMATQYQQYVQGYVNSETDQDWFSYYIEDGQCVRFWINMQYRTKSYDSADMQLVIYKPDNSILGMNNDGGAYNDPAIKVCVTETGTYTVRAKLEKGALPAADADKTYQLMAQWLDVPTLTAPANGSSTTDHTPTFTWQAVELAKIYDIQVARDAGFTDLVFQTSVRTLTYTPTTNLTNDTYYWRVRARNLRYIGDYSDAWTVTITNP